MEEEKVEGEVFTGNEPKAAEPSVEEAQETPEDDAGVVKTTEETVEEAA